jgi:hypothetical protein
MSSSPPTSAQAAAAGLAGRTASSVIDLIGRTPLIRLRRFERETPGVELYAKPNGRILADRSRIARPRG